MTPFRPGRFVYAVLLIVVLKLGVVPQDFPVGTSSHPSLIPRNLTLGWPIKTDKTHKVGKQADLNQMYSEYNAVVLDKFHTALDISAVQGTTVVAAAAGIVRVLGPDSGITHFNHCFGNVVIIDHGTVANPGPFTLYAHLDSFATGLVTGVSVNKGQVIAYSGNTGRVDGCPSQDPIPYHLHFELKNHGVLGSSSDDDYFGYTPKGSPPDTLGYHDPILNLHKVTEFATPLQVMVGGNQSVNLRVGPGGANSSVYRSFNHVSPGEQYAAIRYAPPTTKPSCSTGWYQLVGPSVIVSSVPEFVDLTYSTPDNTVTIPWGWVCADFVDPLSSGGPSIAITPNSGIKGVTPFTKSGSGFTPRGSVTQSIVNPDGSVNADNVKADKTGAYIQSNQIYNTPAGTYHEVDVDAATGRKSNQISWSLTSGVGPNITINPNTGTAGHTQFTITGTGASPGGGVTATATYPKSGAHTFSTTADNSGNFGFGPFTLYETGSYGEYVTDDATNVKSNTVTWTVTTAGLILGTPVSGTLTTVAPAGHCNYGAPADTYSLHLDSPATLTFSLSSTAFDSLLCIVNSGGIIAQDDDGGGSLNSRTSLSLSSGDYTIEATSFGGDGAGDYILSANVQAIVPVSSVNIGDVIVENLSASAPPAHCNGGTPADRYSLTVSGPVTITIDVSSWAFDTHLCLLNSANQRLAEDGDTGTGTNSRIRGVNLSQPGTYFIEVTTRSPANMGGVYTLSLAAGLPTGKPIVVAQQKLGRLSAMAANGQCNGSAPADVWQFTTTTSGTYTIDVASTAFDTHVCVLNSVYSRQDEDYDSGTGNNARIRKLALNAGTYYIEVSSNSPNNTGGSYTLNLQPWPWPVPPVINVGQSQTATLSDTAANGQCNGSAPADVWQFTTTTNGTYTIDVASTAFDTHVCVLNSVYSRQDEDYDSGTGNNARIRKLSLNAGTYYIEVSSNSPNNTGGSYTLNLQPWPWPVPPVINVGQSKTATLSDTAANGQCNGSAPADVWQFTTTTNGTYTIDVASTVFDTHVCVLDSVYSRQDEDYDSGTGNNARVRKLSLNAGTYYIEVSSNSPNNTGGSYTLNLQPWPWPVPPVINVGQSKTATLSDTAANGQCNGSAPADVWQFTVGAGTYTLDVTSTKFITHACLLNSTYGRVAEVGGTPDSHLTQTISSGTYYVEISSDSPGHTGGQYSLSLH